MDTTLKNIEEISNVTINNICENRTYEHHIFTRVSAKKLIFTGVVFNFSTFEHCYFRTCKFDSCKFIGCKFISSNFEGSEFIGCTFDYSTFRFTNIDESILDNNCPSYENVRLKFARSLRTNFFSQGNTEGVNKAINIELSATKIYLFKSWQSNESYYRKKYKGLTRIYKFFHWLKFKTEELIWGNGESLWKLARAFLIILILITLYENFINGDINSILSFWTAFKKSPIIFFSIDNSQSYSQLHLCTMFFVRSIFLGLFMAIVIKRFSKR